MLIDYHLGQTSIVLRVVILDSTVATGAGKTGLTNATSGLNISAIADSEGTAATYTAAGSTIDTIVSLSVYSNPTAGHCRFKEVDATNLPGLYELQLENTRYAVSNARSLVIFITGAAGAAPCRVCIPLRAVDPYNANFGLTNLDAAVSTRSTYAGADTAGTTTLLGRLTTTRAANLDNLDAAISTRSTYAGGAVASVTSPVTVGTNNDKTGYSLSGTQTFNNTGQTTNLPADIQTIKTQTVTCSAGVTVGPFVGTANLITTDSNGRLKIQVGTGVGQINASNGAVPVVPATAADLANANSLGRLLWLLMPNDGSSLTGTLPDQTAATTTTMILDSAANSANVRPGYIVTVTSGTDSGKGRFITAFNSSTKVITLNNAWTTSPATGDTYRIDPPAKVTVAGYNNLQSPDTFVLATPGQPIATDSSGNVSIAAAGWANVWTATGAPTIADGVVQANVVEVLGDAATLDEFPTTAAIATAVINDTADMVSPPVGSLGAKVNAAGAAGDPLATDLATAGYTGTQAGAILYALDDDTLLTFRTQDGSTAPTRGDALALTWAGWMNRIVTQPDDSVKLYGGGGTSGPVIVTYSPPEPAAPNLLDRIDVADPGAPANWTTFPKAFAALFRRFMGRAARTLDETGHGTIQLFDQAGNTVNATQAITDDGQGNETQGEMV